MASESLYIGDKKNETILLACVEKLRVEHRSDLQSIQSAMLKDHNISFEKTEAMLNSLKSNAKMHTIEKKGVTTYLVVHRPNQLTRSKSNDLKETSALLIKCIRAINQDNGNSGASMQDILKYLKDNEGPSFPFNNDQLQKALDEEVSFLKISRNHNGLYFATKKRGRPSGSPSNTKQKAHRMSSAPTLKSSAVKKSPDETGKRTGNLGKRKRIKKSSDDYEFYDTPGNTSMQIVHPSKGEPICDFCLKSASCNRQSKFEELLVCKDCSAKAHPSCMGYSEILARRASAGPWQCIDCKTCCCCLESGDPDDLLFCDACDKGYHIFCHDPAIKEKPKNKWACNACINDGVLPEDLVSSPDELLPESPKPSETAAEVAAAEVAAAEVTAAEVATPTTIDSVPCEPEASADQSNLPASTGEPAAPTTPPLADAVQPAQSSPKIVLPEVPSHWTVTHVSQYIQQCGFPAEAQRFYEQEIDGKSFMLLMRQDVLCNMNLKLGPALKIYEKIKSLQKGPAVRSQQQ